eukprot:scaffold32165_cov147-Skeletonema_marinoi.AAC.8
MGFLKFWYGEAHNDPFWGQCLERFKRQDPETKYHLSALRMNVPTIKKIIIKIQHSKLSTTSSFSISPKESPRRLIHLHEITGAEDTI